MTTAKLVQFLEDAGPFHVARLKAFLEHVAFRQMDDVFDDDRDLRIYDLMAAVREVLSHVREEVLKYLKSLFLQWGEGADEVAGALEDRIGFPGTAKVLEFHGRLLDDWLTDAESGLEGVSRVFRVLHRHGARYRQTSSNSLFLKNLAADFHTWAVRRAEGVLDVAMASALKSWSDTSRESTAARRQMDASEFERAAGAYARQFAAFKERMYDEFAVLAGYAVKDFTMLGRCIADCFEDEDPYLVRLVESLETPVLAEVGDKDADFLADMAFKLLRREGYSPDAERRMRHRLGLVI